MSMATPIPSAACCRVAPARAAPSECEAMHPSQRSIRFIAQRDQFLGLRVEFAGGEGGVVEFGEAFVGGGDGVTERAVQRPQLVELCFAVAVSCVWFPSWDRGSIARARDDLGFSSISSAEYPVVYRDSGPLDRRTWCPIGRVRRDNTADGNDSMVAEQFRARADPVRCGLRSSGATAGDTAFPHRSPARQSSPACVRDRSR
jgi:hypothetical protein